MSFRLYSVLMDIKRKIELLDQQIEAANNGQPENFLDWKNTTEVVLRNLFGEAGTLSSKFQRINYRPRIITSSTDYAPYQVRGVREGISLLKSAKTDLEISAELQQGKAAQEVEEIIEVADKGEAPGKRVFIVHGHDGEHKHELARFLQSATGHEPVILHEQSNRGAVLIEKLEANAETTGFAVVLMTADDTGKANREEEYKPRARQNVVFELGFFIAALGREKVAVLMEPGVEEPGDVTGLVYTPLDPGGAWKMALIQEISDAGINVNWQALAKK